MDEVVACLRLGEWWKHYFSIFQVREDSGSNQWSKCMDSWHILVVELIGLAFGVGLGSKEEWGVSKNTQVSIWANGIWSHLLKQGSLGRKQVHGRKFKLLEMCCGHSTCLRYFRDNQMDMSRKHRQSRAQRIGMGGRQEYGCPQTAFATFVLFVFASLDSAPAQLPLII